MIKEILFKIQQQFKSSKNLVNDFAKFNYRNLECMLGDLKPILAIYNCIITFDDEIVNVGNSNYIKSTATLTHIESGEEISTTAFAREDETKAGMSAGQMTGCGSSYSRKYALCGLCAVNEEKDLDALDNRPKTTTKPQVNNNVNNPYKPDNLEWTPEEENNVVQVQMTKQLTPVEQIDNWYNTVEHNQVNTKFHSYWRNRLLTKGWTGGAFNLNNLIQKYCK